MTLLLEHWPEDGNWHWQWAISNLDRPVFPTIELRDHSRQSFCNYTLIKVTFRLADTLITEWKSRTNLKKYSVCSTFTAKPSLSSCSNQVTGKSAPTKTKLRCCNVEVWAVKQVKRHLTFSRKHTAACFPYTVRTYDRQTRHNEVAFRSSKMSW